MVEHYSAHMGSPVLWGLQASSLGVILAIQGTEGLRGLFCRSFSHTPCFIGYGIYCGGPNREFYLGFAKITLPVYIVVAYLLSYFASMSIESTFGLSIEELDFFKLMLVPFSLPFFEW